MSRVQPRPEREVMAVGRIEMRSSTCRRLARVAVAAAAALVATGVPAPAVAEDQSDKEKATVVCGTIDVEDPVVWFYQWCKAGNTFCIAAVNHDGIVGPEACVTGAEETDRLVAGLRLAPGNSNADPTGAPTRSGGM